MKQVFTCSMDEETVAKIREAAKNGEGNADVSKDEYATLLGHYKNLAYHADSDITKEKCTRYLLDEHKGRNDGTRVPTNGAPINNIAIFNEGLSKARERIEDVKAKAKKKDVVIELETI